MSAAGEKLPRSLIDHALNRSDSLEFCGVPLSELSEQEILAAAVALIEEQQSQRIMAPARVIMKRRGDDATVYYACGPVRWTREAAEVDLERLRDLPGIAAKILLEEALRTMTEVFRPRTGPPGPDMEAEQLAWTTATELLAEIEANREGA